MIHLTKPDAAWLLALLVIIEEIQYDYPELFSRADEETLVIAAEIIKGLNK